jgi:23S rRNA (uracil1939-C5)-methyltransferase
MKMLKCEYSDKCGACSLWEISYEAELKEKENVIMALLQKQELPNCEVEILNCGYTQLRDRADIQWRAQTGWGFVEKLSDPIEKGEVSSYSNEDNKPTSTVSSVFELKQTQIHSIKKCLLFSPELQKFYQWFSSLSLPVPIASARLRVSPIGEWGVWLDMSNLHVKELLEEKNYLQVLQSRAFVEIGQRRKKLSITLSGSEDFKFKLTDPEFRPWFQTYSNKLVPMPLYCSVGSFTQVGFGTNRLMVKSVLDYLAKAKSKEVIELGSGIGNFTLAVLSSGAQVLAIENDRLALDAFNLNLNLNYPHFLPKVNLQKVDFNQVNSAFIHSQLKHPKEASLLVDPPRSGLGRFLSYDFWQEKPFASIIYVSCSLDSWGKDARQLLNFGYQLKKITLVDQFPRTNHLETISYWVPSL